MYIVRVQPAFPGMPQMPGEGGAPSDIGPDGGVLPPDAIGPDGLPMGGADPAMGMDEEDAGGFPPEDPDEEEGGPPGDLSGPPGAVGEEEGGGNEGPPPPPKKKDKGKKKGVLTGVRTYRGLDGTVMTEEQFERHLAVVLSGGNPHVLTLLRSEARGRGPAFPQPWPDADSVRQHIATKHPEIHPMPRSNEDALATHARLHEHLDDTPGGGLDHAHGIPAEAAVR